MKVYEDMEHCEKSTPLPVAPPSPRSPLAEAEEAFQALDGTSQTGFEVSEVAPASRLQTLW